MEGFAPPAAHTPIGDAPATTVTPVVATHEQALLESDPRAAVIFNIQVHHHNNVSEQEAPVVTTAPEEALEQVPDVDSRSVEQVAPLPPAIPASVLTASDGPAPMSTGDGLSTAFIASCFSECYFTEQNWPKRLSDTGWLDPFRIGAPGLKGGVTGRFDPLGMAIECCARKQGNDQKKLVRSFTSRFNTNPVLAPWKDAFNQHAATYFDPD